MNDLTPQSVPSLSSRHQAAPTQHFGRVQRDSWPLASILLLFALLLSPAGYSSDLSQIEVPIEVALTGIRDQLEKVVPRQRHQANWRRQDGVSVRYRIWRGPLSLQTYQDRLHLSADVGYWVSVRKKLLGPLKVKGDCGLREPPRLARVHVSSRLYWGHDWRLHTETRAHPNRFANPCRLTRARIDVTPIIDRQLNRKMNQVLREQVDRLVPQVSRVRNQAELVWRTLQTPIRLDHGAWLLLQPEAVHAAPFRTNKDSLTTAIGLTMRPKVVFGQRPETDRTALPNIDNRPYATKPSFNLLLDVDLPLRSINERLKDIAAGRLEQLGLSELDLKQTRLSVDQHDLVLQMPSLSLRTRPVLDKDLKRLILNPVSFASGTSAPPPVSNATQSGQTWLADLLDETLSWSYKDRMQAMRSLLETALNQPLHPRVQLGGRIDGVEPESIHIEPDRIHAKVRVTGNLSLLVK